MGRSRWLLKQSTFPTGVERQDFDLLSAALEDLGVLSQDSRLMLATWQTCVESSCDVTKTNGQSA